VERRRRMRRCCATARHPYRPLDSCWFATHSSHHRSGLPTVDQITQELSGVRCRGSENRRERGAVRVGIKSAPNITGWSTTALCIIGLALCPIAASTSDITMQYWEIRSNLPERAALQYGRIPYWSEVLHGGQACRRWSIRCANGANRDEILRSRTPILRSARPSRLRHRLHQ
jgi:hypothetical protein